MECNYKKIGLFGGTFNPPHMGHVRALESFCREICPDVVYIMPSNIPPHKEISEGDSPALRFHMAQLAFGGNQADISEYSEKTVFSAIEISRTGKSYSIDTVNKLISLFGCEKIYMYVGSDMLFCFEQWKDYKELFKKCVLVTAARCSADQQKLKERCEEYRVKYDCEYILLPLQPFDISSTELRDMLSCKNSLYETKKYLTGELYEYIIKNDVYCKKSSQDDITSKKTTEEIRGLLPHNIDKNRLEHTFSVEKTALSLAEIYLPLYGYSDKYLEDISAAALLHDFTKNRPQEWHESYLNRFMRGFAGYPAVYHSWSAAYYALENFFVNPRVFRAVYSHTTGRADMDIFEKIIYLADFIEPGRKHDSCIKLREKFNSLVCRHLNEQDKLINILDKIILESLDGTLEHLKNSGKPVCPLLFEASDFLSDEKNVGFTSL